MTHGRYWLLVGVPAALQGFAWGWLGPYVGMPMGTALVASVVIGFLWSLVCGYIWGPYSERAHRKGWYR